MKFELLQAATSQFSSTVNEALGRPVIKPMTLEIPVQPPDELHFYQLVVWCYGFFYEAAIDVLKEFKALMRQGPPERTNRFDRALKIVNNLRTYKVHNLPGKENDNKRKLAEQWIRDASCNGRGIAGAVEDLCRTTLEMVGDLNDVWKSATQDMEDLKQLVERMVMVIEKTWQPHELDAIVTDVATEIDLPGFDAKAFRDLHLEEWRKTANCFIDRETAETGLRRHIRSLMQSKFGSS